MQYSRYVILHLIQYNNNNNNNNNDNNNNNNNNNNDNNNNNNNNNNNSNNNSLVFWGFFMFNFAFFSFICLFHCYFMPTNACMGNFSIKRLSDSKILKI